MNGFLLRLKSILNGNDFLDDDFKSKGIIEKINTKPEETIIYFDPPPFNDLFDSYEEYMDFWGTDDNEMA